MTFDFRDKTFLVTGGCGFVGSNIVHKLVASGVQKCIVLDNLYTGNRDFLPKNTNVVSFVKGSVTEQDILEDLFPQVDYIIHCAAVNIMAAQENPMFDLKVNSLGTLRMLETAVKFKNIKKFVYTSSGSVYGNPESLPITETSRLKPMSNYAVSKLAGENYTRVYYLIENLPTAIVRYSNVYGPNQSPKNPYCGVIGKFIESAISSGVVNVFGRGLQTRDFTYVEDAVDATILATVEPKSEGRVFNVATGYEVSVIELANKIFALLGIEPQIYFIDKRDIDNISRRCLNIEEIRTTLKWEPLNDIDTGLRKTIEWYKSSELAFSTPLEESRKIS